MSNDLGSLSDDHVRQLGHIVETLEKSAFDYLQFEIGELKVTIGKGNIATHDAPPSSQPQPAAASHSTPLESPPAAAAPSQPARAISIEGTVEITSPIMGMFYSQPEPGAPTFVTVGDKVVQDTTVGLIEVMKTFNAVVAGVRGTIEQVCAPNAQLVEYGQVLFRVRPE